MAKYRKQPNKMSKETYREIQWQVFVGRKREIKDFENLLDNIGKNKAILWLYGFGGLGKSTLIKKLKEVAKKRKFRILPKFGGVLSNNITSFLVEAFKIPIETKTHVGFSHLVIFSKECSFLLDDENIWKRFFYNIRPKSIIFIDTTVNVDMEKLTAFVNFIDALLVESGPKKILIVIAARDKPDFQQGTYVEKIKLEGLAVSDVKELVSKRAWTWINPGDEQLLYEKSMKGNPKLIELICANHDVLNCFKAWELKITHSAEVEDFLTAVWRRWSEKERDAISRLSAIALFSSVFEEEMCKYIIDSWESIRRQLEDKAVLKYGKYRHRVSVHDLIRDFAYPRLREKEKVHRRLGEYYRSKDPCAALRHYMQGSCLEGIEKIYDKACQRMHGIGGFREIYERSYKILSDFEGVIHEEFEAKLLLNCGGFLKLLRFHEIPQALPYLEKATKAFKNLNNIARYGETLAHKGKVLRFVGNLELSLEMLDEAKTIFEENKEERWWYGWTLRQHAHTLRQLGRLEEALSGCVKSKSIFSDLGDEGAFAWSIYGEGIVLSLLGRHEEALQCLFISKRIFEKGRKDGEEVQLVHIAELYRLKGNYKAAEDSYLKYLNHYSKLPQHSKDLADALLGLAELKRVQQRGCEEDYSDPLEIYENVKCKWGIVNTLIGKSLAIIQDKWAEAEDALKRAEEICMEQAFKPELELTRKILRERNPKEFHPLYFP